MGGSALNPQQPLVARVGATQLQDIDPDLVFSALSAMGFRDTAAELGIPTHRLWAWIQADPAKMDAYRQATEARAHLQVDEADEITRRVLDGDLDPKRADPRVKFLQWRASKTKAYADKREVEHNHNHTIRLDPEDLRQRLESLASVAHQRSAQPVPLIIDHEPTTTNKV